MRVFRIDWRFVNYARDRNDTLIVYSADPLGIDGPNRCTVPRSQAPRDCIWLLSHVAEGVPAAEIGKLSPPKPKRLTWQAALRFLHGVRARFWAADPSLAAARDPSAARRLWRQCFGLVLMAPLLPLFHDGYRTRLNRAEFWTGSGLWLFVTLASAYVGLVFAYTQVLVYLVREHRASPDWTATTTRCLDDGKRVRNGLRRAIPAHGRRWIRHDRPHPAHRPLERPGAAGTRGRRGSSGGT